MIILLNDIYPELVSIKDISNAMKINLGLKVKGKDEKGYHLLDMVMLPISLCDNIEITKRDDEEVNVIVTNNNYLPKENSITKLLQNICIKNI